MLTAELVNSIIPVVTNYLKVSHKLEINLLEKRIEIVKLRISTKVNTHQLGHEVGEALGNIFVLVDEDYGPLLEFHGHQHVVVGRLPAPVSLGVDSDGGVLAEEQLLCCEQSSVQLDALRSQSEVPVEEFGAGLGRVVHVLDELLQGLERVKNTISDFPEYIVLKRL